MGTVAQDEPPVTLRMHPTLLQWGPIHLHSYGLLVGLGFLLALTLAGRRAAELSWDRHPIQTLTVVALVAGLVGARAAYVAMNWGLYRQAPLEILRLDHGGLVFYGGLAAGLAAAGWVLVRHRLPLWRTLDLLVPPLVAAHALGRIGCFFNGCCYGKPTTLPWGVAFPGEGAPRHPTQLLEAAFLFLLFLALRRIERKSAQPGTVLALYGLSYGIWRFLIEFLRGDNPAVALGWTAFQWASVLLILVSGSALGRMARRRAGG